MSGDVKRRPVKGFFGGLLVGIGLSLLAMVWGGVVVASVVSLVIVLGGAVLGIAAAFVLPARAADA